jgi:dTDP-4-dehydrorhamnose 3,5-epimerase
MSKMNKMDKTNPRKLDSDAKQEGVIYEEIKRFADDRGDFTNVALEIGDKTGKKGIIFKRSYIINNNQQGVVRGFHGHRKENKLFFVPRGCFKFIIMNMETREWKEYILSEAAPKILFVPGGHYNGFVSLTDDALLITFSSSSMEESIKDDVRLPFDTLGKEVWNINHR